MTGESERMARAGNYVLGLMDDGERERAERDLETDAAFRDAVVVLAERMRRFERPATDDGPSDRRWRLVAAHIASLPQMRMPDGAITSEHQPETNRVAGGGLHALGGRRGLAIAAGLVAAWAFGYAVGVSTGSRPPAAPAAQIGQP